MARPLLSLCLVVLFVLAGCTEAKTDDGEDRDTLPLDPTDPDADMGNIDFSQGVPLPPWSIGDWWQYKVQYNSGESFDTKIIVHGEDGSGYQITAEDRELVLRAQFNHYPNFGDVRKSDLGQKIHGADVPDLQFPMKEGTWTGQYRDFAATWNATYAMLETPKGTVPGFRTTMVDDRDGLVRIANGWSPVTKWFTDFTFDFDGVDPIDVTFTLQDWGTNHTGSFPVVTIFDGVHRPFPAVGLDPPDAANPPAVPQTAPNEAFAVGEAGASVLWGMFAGAGGPGRFQATVTPPPGGQPHPIEWQPAAAGGHFAWGEITEAAAGEWMVEGQGAAQGLAFMFLETYEARTTPGALP